MGRSRSLGRFEPSDCADQPMQNRLTSRSPAASGLVRGFAEGRTYHCLPSEGRSWLKTHIWLLKYQQERLNAEIHDAKEPSVEDELNQHETSLRDVPLDLHSPATGDNRLTCKMVHSSMDVDPPEYTGLMTHRNQQTHGGSTFSLQSKMCSRQWAVMVSCQWTSGYLMVGARHIGIEPFASPNQFRMS
eukprot:3914357-Amphidinium_carterae.1